MLSLITLIIYVAMVALLIYVNASHLIRETTVKSDNLPYLHSYNNRIIETEDGLMVVTKICGELINYLSESRRVTDFNKRDDLFSKLLPQNCYYYFHRVRDPITPIPASKFSVKMAAMIDDAWWKIINNRAWEDTQYLTFFHPFLSKKFKGKNEHKYISHLLIEAQNQFVSDFADYRCAPLVYNNENGHSPQLAFLNRVINQEARKKISPQADFSFRHVLAANPTIFNKRRFQCDPTSRSVSSIIRLKGYSSSTAPAMLATIENFQCSYVLCHSYKQLESHLYLEKLSLDIKRRINMEDRASSTIEELKALENDIASNRITLGEHQLTLILTADDPAYLDEVVIECIKDFKNSGLSAKEELSFGIETAYYGSFPGNIKHLSRLSVITSENMADLVTFHCTPFADQEPHFLGRAETILDTFEGTAREVSLYNNDVGNTIIVGESGSGKTVLLNFLASQMNAQGMRYYNTDINRSSMIPILSHGGQYFVVDHSTPFFNPFLLVHTDENIRFFKTFVQVLMGDISTAQENQISESIDMMISLDESLHTLTQLAELFKGLDTSDYSLYERIKPFIQGGQYGNVFDNSVRIKLAAHNPYYGFDLTSALDEERLVRPVVFATFHVMETDAKAHENPYTFSMEEAWKYLDSPYVLERIKKYEKTSRAQKGRLILITQDADDIVDSSICKAIVNQTSTYFIYPGDSDASTYRSLGLTSHQVKLLSVIPRRSRQFLYVCGDTYMPLQFNFNGSVLLDTTLVCNKERLRLFEEARNSDPSNFLPMYFKEVNRAA